MDQYAVIGNPIAHSKSPRIHAAFAAQCAQDMRYAALLAPLDGFAATVASFRDQGGKGLNVTVPFKLEAHALADSLSARAHAAGAVNTLRFDADGTIFGDNTDGAGLVRDLLANHDCALAGRAVLLLGAGGAARGAVLPLLEQQPEELTIANRTAAKAQTLAQRFASDRGQCSLAGCGLDALGGKQFDVVINATAASLADQAPELPPGLYRPAALAYDMMYGRGDTPFLAAARDDGASRLVDGLGMLVEQAAESFLLWRGVRPDTTGLLASLRREAA